MEDLYKRVQGFCAAIQEDASSVKEAEEFLPLLQFDVKGGEPFHMQIGHGKITCGKGLKGSPDLEEGLYLTGDEEALASLFTGAASLAEAIYHHKIQISGYRQKEPLMFRFSKLLRRGVDARRSDR